MSKKYSETGETVELKLSGKMKQILINHRAAGKVEAAILPQHTIEELEKATADPIFLIEVRNNNSYNDHSQIETVEAVEAWLESHELDYTSRRSNSGSWILQDTASTPAEVMSELMPF